MAGFFYSTHNFPDPHSISTRADVSSSIAVNRGLAEPPPGSGVPGFASTVGKGEMTEKQPTSVSLYAKFFKNDEFADLKVVCSNGNVIMAHKIVLCSQSSVLEKYFMSGMKESLSGEIAVEHDSPALIERMIEFLYKSDYSNPDTGNEAEDLISLLRFHTDIYRLADMYEITPLAELSKSKYEYEVKKHSIAAFVESIPYVYTTTPDHNNGLQGVVVSHARLHRHDILKDIRANTLFKEAVANIPQFAADIAQEWLEKVVNCGSCQKAFRDGDAKAPEYKHESIRAHHGMESTSQNRGIFDGVLF